MKKIYLILSFLYFTIANAQQVGLVLRGGCAKGRAHIGLLNF
jgi:predicted acylesterase/phospholipase RssA